MRVFLHTRPSGTHTWTNEHREFARVPVVGEFLALESDTPWYEVRLVVHTPFSCECDAEVYAVEVDHLEAKRQAFNGTT